MNAPAAVAAVLAVGVITYASRAGLILFLADRPLPSNVTRALRYVGPAVLSALSISLIAGGQGIEGVTGVEVAALVAGIAAAALSRNLIVSIGVAMTTLWLLLWLT